LKATLHEEMGKMNDIFSVGVVKAAAKNREKSDLKASAKKKRKNEVEYER
jgi:hypothetical protein